MNNSDTFLEAWIYAITLFSLSLFTRLQKIQNVIVWSRSLFQFIEKNKTKQNDTLINACKHHWLFDECLQKSVKMFMITYQK